MLAALQLQLPTSAQAIEFTTGPIYGGAFAWTVPEPALTPQRTGGFLGLTTFGGRFVALERDATVSTSTDGIAWVGHRLPGEVAIDAHAELDTAIAAGPSRVVVVRQGAAWSSADDATWTAAANPPSGTARVTAATAIGDGFIAMGVTGSERAAAVWRSADGSTWQSITNQPAFDHFCPRGLVSGTAATIVAVGDDCYPYLARPAVAVSNDGGMTWLRAPAQSAFAEEGSLHAVIPGGIGFIALGEVVRDVFPGRPYVAIHVSSDGLAWRRVGYFAPPGVLARLFVAAIPGGYLALADGMGRAAAFVSVDGSRWTRSSPLPPAAHVGNDDFSETIQGVASLGNLVVAVGTSDQVAFVDEPVLDVQAFVGQLTPGPSRVGSIPVPPAVPGPVPATTTRQPAFPGTVRWQVAALPGATDATTGSSSAAFDVRSWRGGFAVLGQELAADGAPTGVLWRSTDGIAWTRHVIPTECLGALAATSTTLVAAGTAICRSINGTDWVKAATLPHAISGLVDVVANGSTFILAMNHASPSRQAIRVWQSRDGLRWTTSGSPSTFTGREATALVAGSTGLVMLTRRFVGSRIETAPMTSIDGRRWTLGTVQAAFAPWAQVVLMASGGPGVLAAGAYQPRSRMGAAIWTSADGRAWARVHVVLPASGFVAVGGLAPVGRGYAMFGLLAPPSQEDPARPSAWLSPDGRRWRNPNALPLPTDGPADWVEIMAAAGGTRTVVAVGTRTASRTRVAQVWTGTYQAP